MSATKTGIGWTDSTWNPLRGCSRVSEGCRYCYAERVAIRQVGSAYAGLVRSTNDGPRWTGEVRLADDDTIEAPLHWRTPRRIFVNSMSDLFHEKVPFEWIDRIFVDVIQHELARKHTFQILTKRPARMLEWASRHSKLLPPLPHVWYGVSVEDQATADERIPLLLQTPAAVRFVSYEPALAPVNFGAFLTRCGYATTEHFPCCRAYPHPVVGLDWIIVGGESGPKARPFNVTWARSTVRQCREAGVALFVKQLGSRTFGPDGGRIEWKHDTAGAKWIEWDGALEDLRVREFPC